MRVVYVGIVDCSITLKLFLYVLPGTVNERGKRSSAGADSDLRDVTVQTLGVTGEIRQPRMQYF